MQTVYVSAEYTLVATWMSVSKSFGQDMKFAKGLAPVIHRKDGEIAIFFDNF